MNDDPQNPFKTMDINHNLELRLLDHPLEIMETNRPANSENQTEEAALLLRAITCEKSCLEYLTTRRNVIRGEYEKAQECVVECTERILKWEKELAALSD
jgi:hypothetical protein